MADTEHTCAPRRPVPHLPSKFQVAVPDDAMAPRVPVGTNVEFDQTLTPQDGDGVLIRCADGEVYFRLYRDTFDGHFEAVALDNRYRNSCFDSKLDAGVEVIAVLTGVCARWALDSDGAEALRTFVCAWSAAAKEAEGTGNAYSRLDVYSHLGSGRRLQ
jgi:hypothetical protein